jgi:hypothetical protein
MEEIAMFSFKKVFILLAALMLVLAACADTPEQVPEPTEPAPEATEPAPEATEPAPEPEPTEAEEDMGPILIGGIHPLTIWDRSS